MTGIRQENIDLLILDACIVTMDPKREIIQQCSVAIDDTYIIDIGSKKTLLEKYQAKNIVDANGKVLTPGLINTHTHIFQTFLRGIGQDLPAIDWLHNAIDPSVANIGQEEAYFSAMIGCIEAIRCGTTTLVEYNYANPVPQIGDQVISAYQDVGLRCVYARGILDTGDLHANIIQNLDDELADCERLLKKYKDNDMVSIWIAPYTIMSASKNAFLCARELANKYHTRLTVHAATPSTIDSSLELYGMGDLAWEESIGFLGPDVLAVHCCAPLLENQLAIMQRNEIKVSYNPVSNCYLGEGIAPIKEMLDSGICISLATDGPGSNNNQDMIACLKFAALIQKVKHLDPSAITAVKVFEMATIDGAKSIGKEHMLGSIEIGKKADLILFDLGLVNTSFIQDPIAAIVYSATQENVCTTIVNGQIVMDNRKLTTIDESIVFKQASDVSNTFLTKSGLV